MKKGLLEPDAVSVIIFKVIKVKNFKSFKSFKSGLLMIDLTVCLQQDGYIKLYACSGYTKRLF